MSGRLAIVAALVVIVAACGGGAAATDDYIDAHNAFVEVVDDVSAELAATTDVADHQAGTSRMATAAGTFADALAGIDFGSAQPEADELRRAVVILEQRAQSTSRADTLELILTRELELVQSSTEIRDLTAVLADKLGVSLGD